VRDAALRACEPRPARAVAGWDAEADVVVVGLGCAGACAALSAAASGASVLALERAGGGGGTSALSGGILYLGGGTPLQKQCGFEDGPEEMFKYLMAASGPGPDEAKIRIFCERSVEHYHWLVQQGVPFKPSFYPEPGMEPPSDDGLIFSGSEDAHPFREIARPAPRGHKPMAPAAAGGFLMQKLLAAVARAGIVVRANVRALTLVVEDDGRVAGVVASEGPDVLHLRARRGVVLAAGGFVKNRDLLARHAPRLLECNVRLGCDGDDGSGILMGEGAGGAAIHMDAASISIPLYPPKRLMRGILVGAHGQRFINEDAYYGRSGEFALLRQEGRAFLIVDDAIYERNHAGMEVCAAGESAAELEREIGLPEGSLQDTLALYNRHARGGSDPLFHKASPFVVPLERPPLGAIDCSTGRAIYAVFTLGGLDTLPTGEVRTSDGDVVPGLFAAGRTSSGISVGGYSSGISLADGSFFGRLAGARAAGA
jgi:succinate dehydrogenase/fumarate reductase flavoprotein subunit